MVRMFDATTFIGLAASIMVTVAYIPEVWKTVKLKHTRDLALSWIVTLAVGQVLFFIYGVEIGSIPLAIAAGSAIIMMLIMLACKLKYKNR
jgi:MtN3 and saliva related transmembrane protein